MWNSEAGETMDERQREKREGSENEVDRVGRYNGFQNMRSPHLDLHQSGIYPPICTNSRKFDLESGQKKRGMQDRSRERKLF